MKETIPFNKDGIIEIMREEQPWGIAIHEVHLRSEPLIHDCKLRIFDGDREVNSFICEPSLQQPNQHAAKVNRFWKIDSWPARFKFILEVPHKTKPIDAVLVVEFE